MSMLEEVEKMRIGESLFLILNDKIIAWLKFKTNLKVC